MSKDKKARMFASSKREIAAHCSTNQYFQVPNTNMNMAWLDQYQY